VLLAEKNFSSSIVIIEDDEEDEDDDLFPAPLPPVEGTTESDDDPIATEGEGGSKGQRVVNVCMQLRRK
jgi:hypothetical protein